MYYNELLGQHIGDWTVLSVDSHGADKHTKMLCRCKCGKVRSVDAYSLRHKLTRSCGKCNTIIDEGNHKRCIMKNGASFIFSPEDYELVKKHTWSIAGGYVRTINNGKTVFLHKLIMNVAGEIDHINLDRMDNQRSNLRVASHSENQQNRKAHRDNKTGYKGVCLDKKTDKYIAYINCEKKRYYLGSFITAEKAAEAYDNMALKLHGQFANTNF